MPEQARVSKADLADIERRVQQKIKDGLIVGIEHFGEQQRTALFELCALYNANPILYGQRLKAECPRRC
jgi:hypothetical protein